MLSTFAFLCISISPQETPDASKEIVDHHLHILSPKLIADWKAAGARFSRDDDSYSNPGKFCKTHKISKGFLISMAHLYTSEEFVGAESQQDEQKLVAAENDYVAECVAKAPERFVGFFSINPIRDWAIDEMKRCHKSLRMRGVKLHLPACGVDLANIKHVAAMKNVLKWCEANDVAALIHLSGFGQPFGEVESQRFWNQLIAPHPKLHLYLAHLGASGGYNDRSRAVLSGYQRMVSATPQLAKARVYFDMSGAILAEAVEGVEPTSQERCKQLAEQMLSIGLDHFVFASDYPVFSPTEYIAALRERLPLSSADFSKLLANQSPLFTVDAQSRK